jgi:DNA-binding MarR family transcriptional regulator
MNKSRSSGLESHKSLQILNELSGDDSLTQRDLSSRLDIALGLVNSYIKNLISKGFITVRSIPPRRYAYFLTPKGFAEKSRLTYHLLQDYTRIYREARSGLKELFSKLRASGVKRVAFAGADEVAEIAYITLHETDIELAGVADDELAGKKFFGREIKNIREIAAMDYDCIVVTSYLKKEKIYKDLLGSKTPKETIKSIFNVQQKVNSK